MASSNSASLAHLLREAEAAVRRGKPSAALELLGRAEALQPNDLSVQLFRSLAHRAAGDLAAALQAIDRALELDPYNFLARLSRGWLLEQQGHTRRAAAGYTRALAIVPPDDQLGPDVRATVAHARGVVEDYKRELKDHLLQAVAGLRGRYDEAGLQRFDESLDILAGHARAHVQQPLMLHYPQLPAVPFFERELFPWLPQLEAATPVIREELAQVLDRSGTEEFQPYIAYPSGSPLNDAEELNHSRRWSSYFFWRDGVRQEDACTACPRTAELLERMPLARQSPYAPTAMFSLLEARTRIPPHTGSINTRATVHLPLLLPHGCGFRVGNVTREWRMDEAWVFDDTIRHEAWNDSDSLRVILIFDVWNPYLSAGERELVTAMLAANAEFHELAPASWPQSRRADAGKT